MQGNLSPHFNGDTACDGISRRRCCRSAMARKVSFRWIRRPARPPGARAGACRRGGCGRFWAQTAGCAGRARRYSAARTPVCGAAVSFRSARLPPGRRAVRAANRPGQTGRRRAFNRLRVHDFRFARTAPAARWAGASPGSGPGRRRGSRAPRSNRRNRCQCGQPASVAPPPAVFSQAAPQARASSRTRRM